MLLEIENLFFYAGLLAFSAGVLQIVFALFKRGYGFFKSGVVAMFLGDASFAVAIAFPKKALALFEQMGMNSLPLPSLVAGIIFGVLLILVGGFLFVRSKKKNALKSKTSANSQETLSNTAPTILDNQEKKADPALFSKVIQTQGSKDIEHNNKA